MIVTGHFIVVHIFSSAGCISSHQVKSEVNCYTQHPRTTAAAASVEMVSVHTSPVKGRRETSSQQSSIDSDKLNVNLLDKGRSAMIDSTAASETGRQDKDGEASEMKCDAGSDHLQGQARCHEKQKEEKEEEEEEEEALSRNKASDRGESEKQRSLVNSTEGGGGEDEEEEEEEEEEEDAAAAAEGWSDADANGNSSKVVSLSSGDFNKGHTLCSCTHGSLVYSSPSTTDAMDTKATCSNCQYVYTGQSGKVDAVVVKSTVVRKKVRHELDQGM